MKKMVLENVGYILVIMILTTKAHLVLDTAIGNGN